VRNEHGDGTKASLASHSSILTPVLHHQRSVRLCCNQTDTDPVRIAGGKIQRQVQAGGIQWEEVLEVMRAGSAWSELRSR